MLKQFLSQFDPTNKTITQLGEMVYGVNISTKDLRTKQPEKEIKIRKSLPKTSLKKKLPSNFAPNF